MNRYVIMARENYPGAEIREICRCNSWPETIRAALADYTVTGARGTRIHKYNHVEIMRVSSIKRKDPAAMPLNPHKNIYRIFSDNTANQIQQVLQQVDAMRADNGKQAQARPTAQDRPSLQERQSESPKS